MQYSEHFTCRKLLRHALSPVIMMIFTSLYSVADGLFLSNFTGKEAFAAVNFIIPFLMIFTSTGFMFGTGGSALIAKRLGEKRETEANAVFSILTWGSAITGILLAAVGMLLLRPVAVLQGAEGVLLENSLQYGRLYLLGTPACIVQFEFQSLYATSGKGRFGLYATVASGLLNILLDALFLAVFSWGITGAAFATILSQWLGGLIPFFYYGRKNSSLLRLIRCRFSLRTMLQICANGSSEMVNNVSISIVSLLFNMQLLAYAGDDGIAAYGVLCYINFLFTAIFWGYITGAAPVISYHYGAENHAELKSLLRKSLVIISVCSFLMFLSAEILAEPISRIFAGYDPALYQMTVKAFHLFSFSFLFAGISIFCSSFFTALNNGLISSILSLSRVFLFQVPAVLLFPLIWKLEGIWIAVVAAEFLTVILGFFFFFLFRNKYRYG